MTANWHLATVSDLVDREPEIRPFIVADMIFERTTNMLVGKYGSAKSFFLLYLALCIAACVPAPGGRVAKGVVVYVYAEGAAGLTARVRAFCRHRELTSEDFGSRILFLCKRWDATDEEFTAEMQSELEARGITQVDLIIFDTLSANAFLGFDENRTADMKLLMDALRRLQQLFNCAVLMCHHSGHGGERERGSSDLGAACDAIFFVEKQGEQVTVKQTKSRDVAPIAPIRMRLVPVDDSAVLVEDDEAERRPIRPSVLLVLRVLAEEGQGAAVQSARWQSATGLSKSAFHDNRKLLLDGGFVLRSDSKYILTYKGERLLQASSHNPESGESAGLRKDHPDSVRPVLPLQGRGTGVPPERSAGVRAGVRRTNQEGPGLLEYPWHALEAGE